MSKQSGQPSSTTLAAPASQPGAPSAPPAAPGGSDNGSQATADTAPTRTGEASATDASKSKAQTKAADRRVSTPSGPSPTAHLTRMEWEEELAALEQTGAGERTTQADKPTKANAAAPSASKGANEATTQQTQSQNQNHDDSLQKELDEAAAGAAQAGLEVATPPDAGSAAESELEREPEGGDASALKAWIAKLPKGAQTLIHRLQKNQAKQFALEPTFASPLADVENQEQLNESQKYWQAMRNECSRILREGFAEDGSAEATLPGGKKHKFQSQTDLEKHLNFAERVLDEAPVWKERLMERGRSAPWEEAERIAPGFWTPGTPAHDAALEMLKAAPQIKSQFSDFEVRLAHYARSKQMESDQKPTEEHPHGRAKWVRLELDRDGKVVMPAKKTPVPVNTKPIAEQAPVTSPGASRPAMRQSASQAGAKADEALSEYEKTRDPADYQRALRALEEAA